MEKSKEVEKKSEEKENENEPVKPVVIDIISDSEDEKGAEDRLLE